MFSILTFGAPYSFEPGRSLWTNDNLDLRVARYVRRKVWVSVPNCFKDRCKTDAQQ